MLCFRSASTIHFLKPLRSSYASSLRLSCSCAKTPCPVQNLVDVHGFTGAYNNVKRFVRALRKKAPEQFDRLSILPCKRCRSTTDKMLPPWYLLPNAPILRFFTPAEHAANADQLCHAVPGQLGAFVAMLQGEKERLISMLLEHRLEFDVVKRKACTRKFDGSLSCTKV